jgi:NAD(P)-dependent dehydrogenase (short-subunit alcohol dehydrogenase family)
VYRVPTFAGPYVASKAAVGALSEALRHELGPFGVRVLLVEPSAHATSFADNLRLARNATAESPYHEACQQLVTRLRGMVGAAPEPRQVVDAIYDAVASGDPAFRHPIGAYPGAGAFAERLGAACRSGGVVSLADTVNLMLG